MSTTTSSQAGQRLPPLIVACLAATWIIWGSTYLAIKWALVSLPPFFQMGTRFIVAGLLLMAWSHWRGQGWPEREQWINAAILGALMLGGGYGATAIAEVSIGSGLVVAFIAVVPALVALAQWPYGMRPTTGEAAGIGLGLAGVLMLTQGRGYSASVGGLLAISFACCTWSLGSVWALHGLPGGRKLTLASGTMGYASQMLVGGAILLSASWIVAEKPVLPPDARSLACWAYLVVAGSLIAFSAYMVLLQRTTAALASTYTFINPLIGLLIGTWLGGEQVSGPEWASAGVISLGVVLLLTGRRGTAD